MRTRKNLFERATLNGALFTQNGMKAAPVIHFNEFSNYTTSSTVVNDFEIKEREHPEFGSWREKHLDLGNIRVFEHCANLKQKVNVLFDNSSLDKYVHHCISLEGEMAARFLDHNLSANLRPQTFHYLFLPGDEYHLGMGNQFVNVHIEVTRDYYKNLLSDSERWSAELKEKLMRDDVFYPGEFTLSLPMIQTIHAIFNSPLSGSLRKMLIEAKVLELVALQLHRCYEEPVATNTKNQSELFHTIRQYLIDTFLEEHSLQSIAKHFGINEFSLKKGFKENFQTTVFDFLFEQRMEFARRQLLDTSFSVSEVGGQLGYKYSNHFSAAFKKKFGVSPASIKRM